MGEDTMPKPFSWGDQVMAEIPTAIKAFIAILKIDLLQEYAALMGWHLLSNPFWTARILLAQDIQAKIQIAQGIRDSVDIIHSGQQESFVGFIFLERIA